MKKPLTEIVMVGALHFEVPKETAKAVLILLKGSQVVNHETILADKSDVIKRVNERFSSAGASLQGARMKEDLTQEKLAKKLKISQANLSKMEHGKRTIGKKMAQRIANVLNVDYRIFL
jgi:ribosome-binding protein aMBF1 (putative translation factor)